MNGLGVSVLLSIPFRMLPRVFDYGPAGNVGHFQFLLGCYFLQLTVAANVCHAFQFLLGCYNH